MMSPLYTEYVDMENVEKRGLDCNDYESFDSMLNDLAESDLSASVKRYHLTCVMSLVGYRYQNNHMDNPRTFGALIDFM